MKRRLAVDPIACQGHGLCADIMPEWIGRDEWGYPIIASRELPGGLLGLARRTIRLCPTLALRLEAVTADNKGASSTNPASGNPGPGQNSPGHQERAAVRQ